MHKGKVLSPMMRISLLLTASIITAKYSYDLISVPAWLFLGILSFLLACLTRKLIYSHILALYICVFCIGGLLTTHQIDVDNYPPQYLSNNELSWFTKAKMNIALQKEDIERKMGDLRIEDQDLAVVSAMVLGDKSALDKTTKDSYSRSGASHILAISGLHIGIIFQLIIFLLGGKQRKFMTIVFSLTAVWLYVVFIGMPSSAVRSATMISCYGFTLLSYRQGSPINTLAFTYILLLLFNPLDLFDISFQMSFLAVFSILIFYPRLRKIWTPNHQVSRWGWSLLCVSLAAQIGVTPLIAYYFHTISCYSLLTSFVAIPAATAILYLCASMLLLLILCHLPWVGGFALSLVNLASKALVSITQASNTAFHLSAMLPGACIENIHINWMQLLCIYMVVGSIYLLFDWFSMHHKLVRN